MVQCFHRTDRVLLRSETCLSLLDSGRVSTFETPVDRTHLSPTDFVPECGVTMAPGYKASQSQQVTEEPPCWPGVVLQWPVADDDFLTRSGALVPSA
ncbi:hypothetical protein NFI96_020222 [Prochilodus magdalenae]|nr:hypothetical protein NFI96_020222 [Prochilodus magdalenae]